MKAKFDQKKENVLLPVEIVLAPQWWYKNENITFDRNFFYNPSKRVEVERKMEQALYDRFGQYGQGSDRDKNLPQIGAVHLAAGFLLSEMLGCKVEYKADTPPQVIPLEMDDITALNIDTVFNSPAYKKVVNLVESLKTTYGGIVGDINWGGILNIALDLRGQNLFMDMFDKPEQVQEFFNKIASVLERFTREIQSETGTSSISVNRTVKHFDKPIFLHSECSHTMISVGDYEKFLFDTDCKWSNMNRPFGIHYCGNDPQRYAEIFAKIPHLDFLDVGSGGDVKQLRKYLPNTFFNLRLSPVDIIDQDPEQIRKTIIELVGHSKDPYLTGICCINMDEKVSDEKIDVIFKTVEELKKEIRSAGA